MMASILSTMMTLQSTQLQSCSVPGMDLLGLRLSQTVVKRTHGYPLSALHTSLPYWEAENGANGYTVVCVTRRPAGFCRRRLTSGAAQQATRLRRGSLYAETFTAIKADLEAFSPDREAAHDGHGRLVEGERAF